MLTPDVKKVRTLRFYDIDGNEIDVQDIRFHIDEQELKETKDAIEELLSNA